MSDEQLYVKVGGVYVKQETWKSLQALERKDNRSMDHLVNVALENYVSSRAGRTAAEWAEESAKPLTTPKA